MAQINGNSSLRNTSLTGSLPANQTSTPVSNAPTVNSRNDDKCLTVKSITPATDHLSTEQAQAHGYRVVQEGNPKHGTILILGTKHWTNDLYGLDQDELLPIIEKTAFSQKQVLSDLTTFKIQHVFVEDQFFEHCHKDLESPSWSHLRESRSKLQKLFKNVSFDKDWSLEMKTEVAKIGGCSLHFYLNEDVTLHQTVTPEKFKTNMRLYEQTFERGSVSHSWDDPWIRQTFFTDREKMAMSFIKQFHQGEANPGVVALPFGSGHKPEDFAQYCNSDDYMPRILFKNTSSLDV